MLKIVIAGSRALPKGVAPRLLFEFLEKLPEDTRILLRQSASGIINPFEMHVMTLVDMVGLSVRWCQPNLKRHAGRRSVWFRDVDMIAEADLCLCYYTSDQIGDDRSGTVALVDKAMQLEVPVYAYEIDIGDESLSVGRVGEHDVTDRWAGIVPTA